MNRPGMPPWHTHPAGQVDKQERIRTLALKSSDNANNCFARRRSRSPTIEGRPRQCFPKSATFGRKDRNNRLLKITEWKDWYLALCVLTGLRLELLS